PYTPAILRQQHRLARRKSLCVGRRKQEGPRFLRRITNTIAFRREEIYGVRSGSQFHRETCRAHQRISTLTLPEAYQVVRINRPDVVPRFFICGTKCLMGKTSVIPHRQAPWPVAVYLNV